MNPTIKQQIDAQFELWQHIRRHLHRHPELSFREVETSKFIANLLEEWGIEFEKGWVETGIVATIKGKNPQKKLIAIRADMDALPIQETASHTYKSIHDGVMHACGHDVHTTCALGAAKILNDNKSLWEGTVKIVFQPGEEKWPGGGKLMLDQGLFADQKPDAIHALHVYPELSVGNIGVKAGEYMASADEIYITFKGKGGHGALPEKVIDPVMMMADFLMGVQQIVSRKIPATVPAVLSFGKVVADGATNVIPSEVKLEGTFRTFNEHWRAKAHELITDFATKTAEKVGGEALVDIKVGYPALHNNEAVANQFIAKATELLGSEHVHPLTHRMTAEDFAYMAQQFPACFFRLGTASPNGTHTAGVHQAHFDIDEQALLVGILMFCAVVEL